MRSDVTAVTGLIANSIEKRNDLRTIPEVTDSRAEANLEAEGPFSRLSCMWADTSVDKCKMELKENVSLLYASNCVGV